LSTEAANPYRILLVHDGELGFARTLLGELADGFEERIGPTTHEDRNTHWNLVVGNTARMRELPRSANGVRIAVLSDDSRTLRAMLRRMGVTLMVRQPVHPAAFRLLMLHALYRGPERRRASRSSIGGAVRVRRGLRRHGAILLDLSKTGCRVVVERAVVVGKRIHLAIPPELADGKKLSLKGTTVRCEPIAIDGRDQHAIGIVFDALKQGVRARLQAVLVAHAHGPAVMKGGQRADAVDVPAASSIAPPRPRRERRPVQERVAELKARGAQEVASGDVSRVAEAPSAHSDEACERRRVARRNFERRVIVLSDEAARVLLGRDLAAGGMRVEADADLVMGDRLRIALHVRSGEVPLVVKARVIRDDGERGMVLSFEGLSDADRAYLEKMVQSLPVVCGADAGEEDGGVVVTEILERA